MSIRIRRRWNALCAAGLIWASAGAASAEGGRAAEVLANYEKTGETVSCLSLRQVRDTNPLDDHAILFEASGGAVYLNELNGRCAGLERERRFSYTTPQNRICKGDIISVTDSLGTFRGSCSLGEFHKLSEIEEKVASN